MTCEWMERVALAMDGEWTPEIEAHVTACGECTALLADREFLRETPEIAPEVYQTVRARVMERVRPSYGSWWKAVAALVVAFMGLAWWMTRLPEPERMEVAVSAPKAPAVELAPKPVVRVQVAPRPQPQRADPVRLAMTLRETLDPAPASVPGEVGIRMQTEDPNVVILLVPATGGGDE